MIGNCHYKTRKNFLLSNESVDIVKHLSKATGKTESSIVEEQIMKLKDPVQVLRNMKRDLAKEMAIIDTKIRDLEEYKHAKACENIIYVKEVNDEL